MRRGMVLAISVVMLLAIPAVANAHRTIDDYVGFWTSTDIDGSNQELTITDNGDGTLNFVLVDDGGSFCGDFDPEGNPTNPLTATGTGTIARNGKVTVASFAIVCENGVNGPSIPVTFKVKPHGTMKDSTGVNWILTP